VDSGGFGAELCWCQPTVVVVQWHFVIVESSEQFAFVEKMNMKKIRREKENDVC
jgi:hypothetical protein